MRKDEARKTVADYVPHQDVTRVSVYEVREFADNHKRNARVRRKVIKKAMARSTYVKVPIVFWEAVVDAASRPEPSYFVVDVEGQTRLYRCCLEPRAAFLRRIVDHISQM